MTVSRAGEVAAQYELVRVPGGSFLMGSDEFDLEAPERTVELETFEIGRYPVTVAEYAVFAAETSHELPEDFPTEGCVQ
jgi:formylglycine-generating enzyme required for sulfatase activity